MDKIFEKSQALFGEQAAWFSGHSTQAMETLMADGQSLANTLRSGMESALKHQADFFQAAVDQLKKAGEAQQALLREVFSKGAA